MDMEKYMDGLMIKAIEYAPKIVLAILTLIVGFWLINKLATFLVAMMRRRNLDETVIPFLESIITVLFKALVLVSVAGMFGIETTSFITILGAAGLAVGLALQGSLGHFASGILILLFKPYKVGDLIKVNEFEGHVVAIQVFSTLIRTVDNKMVVIPNGVITAHPFLNISGQGTLRVKLEFMVDYHEDLDRIKSIIMQVMTANEKILKEPAPEVLYNTKGFSLAVYECSFWCKSEHNNELYYQVQEQVRKSFDKNGVKIPQVGLEFSKQ